MSAFLTQAFTFPQLIESSIETLSGHLHKAEQLDNWSKSYVIV